MTFVYTISYYYYIIWDNDTFQFTMVHSATIFLGITSSGVMKKRISALHQWTYSSEKASSQQGIYVVGE